MIKAEEKIIISSIIKAQFLYKLLTGALGVCLSLIIFPLAFYIFIEAVKPQQLAFPNKEADVIFGKNNPSQIIAPEFKKIIKLIIEQESENNYMIEYKGEKAYISPRKNKKVGDILHLKAVDSNGNVYSLKAVFRESSIEQKIELIDDGRNSLNENRI